MFCNTNPNMGNCAVNQTCHSTCETCHTNYQMMDHSCGQMMNHSSGPMMDHSCGSMMNHSSGPMMNHSNFYNK